MSMPSRQWTRLARVAIATVLSATGAVALVPSTASAADEPVVSSAIVDDAGCTTAALPDDPYSTATTTLPSPIRVHGGELSSLSINRYGSLSSYVGNVSLNLYAFWTGHYSGETAAPPTYGQITYAGRPALCVNWLDHTPTGTTISADVQALVVDRSDLQAGDFDVVYNYDRVNLGGATRGRDMPPTTRPPSSTRRTSCPAAGLPVRSTTPTPRPAWSTGPARRPSSDATCTGSAAAWR